MKPMKQQWLNRALLSLTLATTLAACEHKSAPTIQGRALTVKDDRDRVLDFVRAGRATDRTDPDRKAAEEVALTFFKTGVDAILQTHPHKEPALKERMALMKELEIGEVDCRKIACAWDQRFSDAEQLAIVDTAIFADPAIRGPFSNALLYRSGLFNKPGNERDLFVTWALFKQDGGGT